MNRKLVKLNKGLLILGVVGGLLPVYGEYTISSSLIDIPTAYSIPGNESLSSATTRSSTRRCECLRPSPK